MYKALVLGCGNIGAMYDLENDQIQTHVKALLKNENFEVFIFDLDKNITEKIAQKYKNITVLNKLNNLKTYDLVSICTPTFTHLDYLKKCIKASVKVVICEKPITNDKYKLVEFLSENLVRKTKILVNYIRPFQPKYKILKTQITNILATEKATNIIVKYYKGFMNYCSHALNLLEFLFEKRLNFLNFKSLNREYDFFKDDATITAFGLWDLGSLTPVNLIGFFDTNFPIFEIEIYFENHKILIKNGGNEIEIYQKTTEKYSNFSQNPTSIFTDCLDNYMQYVVLEAQHLLENSKEKDNFDAIAQLNHYLISLSEEN